MRKRQRIAEGRTAGDLRTRPDAQCRIDGLSVPAHARFDARPVWDSAGQVTDRRSA
jgi:hypothetical protein